jgi:hypothetical protein
MTEKVTKTLKPGFVAANIAAPNLDVRTVGHGVLDPQ